MDIAKFNQELAYKVAKANGLEKNNRIKEAIKVWIEISEMVISLSKLAKIDFSFRTMLIEKTEQIINHIKVLKQNITPSVKNRLKEPVVKPTPKAIASEIENKTTPKKADWTVKSSSSLQDQGHPEISVEKEKDIKVVESDDIKNLPKGFKEIETSDDFTIVTPYDKEYVEKILTQDIDMSIFKHPESNTESTLEENASASEKDADKLFCYVCGTELPLETKNCPNCGTKLG